MEVYAFAISGSQHAINAHTVEMYSSVSHLGDRILSHYEDLRNGGYKGHWNDKQTLEKGKTFEQFVKKSHSFGAYMAVVDSNKKWNKIHGSKIWDMLKEDPELKPKIVKTILRS